MGLPGGSDSKTGDWVRSLGWEDPLEEGMATHSSILAWRISMDKGVWWATVHGVAKSQTHTLCYGNLVTHLASNELPIKVKCRVFTQKQTKATHIAYHFHITGGA